MATTTVPSAGAGTGTTSVPAAGGGSTAPVAKAGANQEVDTLGVITLDGTGCSGHDSLAWTLTRKDPRDGSSVDKTVLLSDATATSPTFTPEDAEYLYLAEVTATAGAESSADMCSVLVAPFILLDMSTATESNTGQKGGATTLGTTSNIEVAAVHGNPDQQVDSYTAMIGLGTILATTQKVAMKMTCDEPAAGPSSGNAGLYMVVSSSQTGLADDEGYTAGAIKQSGGNFRGGGTSRVGGSVSNEGIITGSYEGFLWVFGDGSVMKAGTHAFKGATTGADAESDSLPWLNSPTDIGVGFTCGQSAASPGAAVAFPNAKFYRGRPWSL